MTALKCKLNVVSNLGDNTWEEDQTRDGHATDVMSAARVQITD